MNTINQLQPDQALQQNMAHAIRFLSMDAVQQAKSGHPGMPMGMADIATVLFSKYLKFDPKNPTWADRDRFVLSNGHGSMLLYAVNYLAGYEGMTLDQLQNFRQLGYHTAGHPEVDHSLGIETTTGPLGQGIANAVGMALAERLMNAKFGDDLVDHRTYVFAGDGCLAEGISHEAISLAGHLSLDKLTVFFDDNSITIDGATDLSVSDNQLDRFRACGWHVQQVDGHDHAAIAKAIETARQSPLPSMIACKTTIGFGSPNKAGTSATHGAPLGDDEIAATREALGWPHAPFDIPDDVLSAWRQAGQRSTDTFQAWQDRSTNNAEFLRRLEGTLPDNWTDAINAYIDAIIKDAPTKATRQLSGNLLTDLGDAIPELIGGSADLTGSNNTKGASMRPIGKDQFDGQYVYYGVREHGMAAAMNGMVLHGGVIPYGGTFLTFTDYCRPSIRLAALMEIGTIFVMTHDSIGLGEDGPTHQPIEHLASLRTMPNLNVFRPCDGVEVAECWQLAIENRSTPSIIVLTRQGLPTYRSSADNLSANGGYILSGSEVDRDVTLIATGSEVSIAMDARETLAKEGIRATVVSVPCWELFKNDEQILGPRQRRIGIEAACPFGWDRFVDTDKNFIGMRSFGASAPAKDLFKHFNITVDAVVERARSIAKGD
ncbi:MAG: transketolase [Alphaproteobacteria bacterium]